MITYLIFIKWNNSALSVYLSDHSEDLIIRHVCVAAYKASNIIHPLRLINPMPTISIFPPLDLKPL